MHAYGAVHMKRNLIDLGSLSLSLNQFDNICLTASMQFYWLFEFELCIKRKEVELMVIIIIIRIKLRTLYIHTQFVIPSSNDLSAGGRL